MGFQILERSGYLGIEREYAGEPPMMPTGYAAEEPKKPPAPNFMPPLDVEED